MSDTPPLVDALWLSQHPEVRIADLRWSLAGPKAREKYGKGHIPGAVFVDLDRDLSRPGGPGRHPFPSPEALAATLGRLGVSSGTQVVAYDDAGGSVAARLWFMLKVHGHERVSLLDGGFGAWLAAGLPLTTEEPSVQPVAPPRLELDRSRIVDRSQVERRGAAVLVDVRAPERYRGETEPIDKRAGHIPGALNLPFAENLGPEGRFRPPAELRARYQPLGRDLIFSCGSGVTACHGALAVELAGLGPARLYVGSWSDWSEDPARPIATGEKPG
jgi:thiosulfate/3-mercaptopyruvate sulfurtransferase